MRQILFNQDTYATCCEKCEVVSTSRDTKPALVRRLGVQQQTRKDVWVQANTSLNCIVRLCGVLSSPSPRLKTFVFLLTASSISGKHSVRCFIGVISRLRRFPFSFSWVNFAVLRT